MQNHPWWMKNEMDDGGSIHWRRCELQMGQTLYKHGQNLDTKRYSMAVVYSACRRSHHTSELPVIIHDVWDIMRGGRHNSVLRSTPTKIITMNSFQIDTVNPTVSCKQFSCQ